MRLPQRSPFRVTPITAISAEAAHALVFDGECLRDKCDQDHDLGFEIFKRFMHIVNERLQSTRLELLDICGKSR
jgi:CRP/FNR family transcriptional regulator, cyclic AMP receptor protein